jgi:hypothetical protein
MYMFQVNIAYSTCSRNGYLEPNPKEFGGQMEPHAIVKVPLHKPAKNASVNSRISLVVVLTHKFYLHAQERTYQQK